VAEIPTGVVADTVSRRLSVVIGYFGMGLGLIAEGAFPSFWPILFAQMFWGVSYTFTSGATEAWLAGEVGEEHFGEMLLRVGRFTYPTALVATLAGFAVGGWNLRLPVIVAGAISLLLALYLALAMPETGFTRDDTHGRWKTLANTTRAGIRSIRAKRALVIVFVAILLWGAASEAMDRLGQPHIIDTIGLPRRFGGELFWLGALTIASILVGWAVVTYAHRKKLSRRPDVLRLVIGLAVVEALATGVFALAGAFAVAAVATLFLRSSRSLRQRLLMGWIVPHTEPATRATALSVFGQADAVGQSIIGPGFGVIGSVASLRAAILASAGLLAVVPPLVATARED
jgi:DHA3 family tetracycline resistance protein-like MFS transporter